MSDYIKRETAMRAVWGCARATGIHDAPFEYASGIIKDLPSADVAPVRHGRWIKHEAIIKGAKDSIECSACGVWIDDMPRKTFCPNCGSIMYRYGESDE